MRIAISTYADFKALVAAQGAPSFVGVFEDPSNAGHAAIGIAIIGNDRVEGYLIIPSTGLGPLISDVLLDYPEMVVTEGQVQISY
jgi:hypothetical protein